MAGRAGLKSSILVGRASPTARREGNGGVGITLRRGACSEGVAARHACDAWQHGAPDLAVGRSWWCGSVRVEGRSTEKKMVWRWRREEGSREERGSGQPRGEK